MYRSLIVPFDGGPAADRALGVAAEVVATTGLDLDLVAVREPGVRAGMDQEMLDRAAERHAVPVRRTLTVTGESPASVFAQLQEDTPDGLLCMGTRGHRGLGEVLFGSTAVEVVRRARRPVLLVGPRSRLEHPRGPVLACVDGSEVGRSVLEPAARWASLLRSGVLVLRVDRPDAPGGEPLDALAAATSAAHGCFASWSVVRQADVPLAIVEVAEQRHAGLLVLATHARSRLRDRVLGSVTLEVLRHAPCPVLVVPPAAA